MIIKIYRDSVAPANLVDTVRADWQWKLFTELGSSFLVNFYTRTIRSKTVAFPTPSAGTHKFLFTIQLSADEATNGVSIAANTAIIQAQLVTSVT